MNKGIFTEMSTSGQPQPSDQQSVTDLRLKMFQKLDRLARMIEEQYKSTWLDLADICISMRDNHYYREGGFESYNAWLVDACPTSRSWAYLAVGVREELQDIPEVDLRQIPMANAKILKNLPRASRKDRKLLQAAKGRPAREFVADAISASPDSHLEREVNLEYRVTTSQAKIILAGFDMWRLLHPELLHPEIQDSIPDGDILEAVWAEWMLGHRDEWEQAKKSGKKEK